MANAMRSLSYEGTLVYAHGNRIESLRIEHRIENGQSRERLESLNGPERSMTRDQDRVTCELPNSHPISVHRGGLTHDVLRAKAIDPESLSAHYLIHPLGTARVAGRQVDVVGIIPRDSLRYGYRFYLDLESGLPLKSDLMGEQSEPIEQIMFTSLELLPSVGSPRNEDVDADAADARAGISRPTPVDTGPWRFTALPAGFDLTMYDHWRDTAGHSVDHFLLSDGLASVSVYVESDAVDGLEGETRIGAIHAAGKRVFGHQVTVIGEVPSATVQMVLAALQRGEEGQP
jgi:sigma-E factor negative regulatory protein RseB